VPEGVQVVIERGGWEVPAVFPWIQSLGNVAAAEMERVFNMGIGMVLVVSPHFADSIRHQLADLGHPCWAIGTVREASAESERVVLG
jgi:phosphoribosylformylglycinamidine cyclo-ligase